MYEPGTPTDVDDHPTDNIEHPDPGPKGTQLAGDVVPFPMDKTIGSGSGDKRYGPSTSSPQDQIKNLLSPDTDKSNVSIGYISKKYLGK